MTHILQISRNDPVVHLKAYGGVRIQGVDQPEVQCEIDAPQLATLMEENGHVYITANSSCKLTIPIKSSVEVEKGMGSISIHNIQNHIQIEKALGNLVLSDINSAKVEKVGGNFAVRNASGEIRLEKVGSSLVADSVQSLRCEKVGGQCIVKNVDGNFSLGKAGGKFLGQDIKGLTSVYKTGGSFVASSLTLNGDVRAGGNIRIANFNINKNIELHAGGNIDLAFTEDFPGASLEMNSGAYHIRIKLEKDNFDIGEKVYEYKFGEGKRDLYIIAGGEISIGGVVELEEEVVGDLSSHFNYEESAFNELIQERIESATRRAEAKIKAAEIRLAQIKDRVEKHRGFNINLDVDDVEAGQPVTPVPPVTRPAGKKRASDEERLMILKMLQEKKITVDEAEALFKALED
jgi:hypothetical protein